MISSVMALQYIVQEKLVLEFLVATPSFESYVNLGAAYIET
jgi:hypothetical protein